MHYGLFHSKRASFHPRPTELDAFSSAMKSYIEKKGRNKIQNEIQVTKKRTTFHVQSNTPQLQRYW